VGYVMPNAVRHPMRSGGDPSLALGMTGFFLVMPSGARHPSLRSGRRLMRRPLGQSPRGDTGACHAERMRGIPFPLSLSFRGVPSEAKDAEESHEEIPRFARDDRPPACHFVRDGVS
jgi:hypothetical protein